MKIKFMNKRSKKKALKLHFQNRSLERVGILLDTKELIRLIQKNNSNSENLIFLKRQSNRVSKYLFKFKEKEFYLFYDKERKALITIFEKDKEKLKKQVDI